MIPDRSSQGRHVCLWRRLSSAPRVTGDSSRRWRPITGPCTRGGLALRRAKKGRLCWLATTDAAGWRLGWGGLEGAVSQPAGPWGLHRYPDRWGQVRCVGKAPGPSDSLLFTLFWATRAVNLLNLHTKWIWMSHRKRGNKRRSSSNSVTASFTYRNGHFSRQWCPEWVGRFYYSLHSKRVT